MPEGLLSAGSPRIASLPQWGRLIGGGFAAIDEEVAAVLAFVISHMTLLAAQDDETGRCPKVCGEQVSRFELYKHRPQGRE